MVENHHEESGIYAINTSMTIGISSQLDEELHTRLLDYKRTSTALGKKTPARENSE